MFLYTVVVDDRFTEKFENFLTNLNVVNSKKVVTLMDKKEVVAIPKEES
jgi:hypothetical protein